MEAIRVVPSGWTVLDVGLWAEIIGLPPTARRALEENDIDGPTLLTLSKADLREELLISSLAVRRYLWDAIERLRGLHEVSDYKVAIDILNEEIDAHESSPPETHQIDVGVLQALRSEVMTRRRVVDDDDMARTLQGEGGASSLRVYEDADVAADHQRWFDQLYRQEELDHAYALSLSQGRGRPVQRSQANTATNRRDTNNAVRSLMSLSIDSCASNRINVAEALQSGEVAVPRRSRFGQIVSDNEGTLNSTELVGSGTNRGASLLPISKCCACYQSGVQCFELACSHMFCKGCMTRMVRSSMQDRSMLPLKCCNIPIDMYLLPQICLSGKEYERFVSLVVEVEAKKKMNCPSCKSFINLDLINTKSITEIQCDCGAGLCVICESMGHPGMTCSENKARPTKEDEKFLSFSKKKKWKQCPGCNIVIELDQGCNHMKCLNCNTEFCYQCRSPWNERTGKCSSGKCLHWQEENIVRR